MTKAMRNLILMLGVTSAVCAAPAAARTPQAVPEMRGAGEVAGAPKCDGAQGYRADFGGRRTFLWRPEWLRAIADAAQADPVLHAKIVRAGEGALARGPYSVTDKSQLVPGSTANDYTSIGPYWWPDPGKKDGLPYIRRDGDVNPERNGPEFDKVRLNSLANDVEALALAHYISGEDRFAQHAGQLIRVWFLDPATRMNPHLNFAQGIPGRVNGRGFGIIDSGPLSTIVEAVGLLRPSGALTTQELAALRSWYSEFVVWLVTSKNGEEEMRTTNNHGVFYDFYVAHFALYAGAPSAAANVIDNFPQYRLSVQMDKQGRFIRELKRTRSWHYSHYVVNASARLATIAECVDRNLWAAELPDGRSLNVAKMFLDRYSGDPASWPFKDMDHAAGRFDRMRQTGQKVDILFQARDAQPAWDDLP